MYFFDSSRAAHHSLTETFDFAAPAQGALWNFRWQLLGYIAVRPNVNEDELHNRFLHATPINYRNLRGWSARSWEATEQQLARFLIVNLFAVYEGWTSSILSTLGAASKENERALQFPSSDKKGYDWLLKKLPLSTAMTNSFGKTLSAHKRYDIGHLDSLLTCYRAFKELRNAIAHAGGLATQRTVDANDAFGLLKAADLGMKQIPAVVPPSPGSPVNLVLRGIIGLSEVMLRLVATLDGELAKTKAAETVLATLWQTQFPGVTKLSPYKSQRHARLVTMSQGTGLPRVADLTAFADLLKTRKLVSFY